MYRMLFKVYGAVLTQNIDTVFFLNHFQNEKFKKRSFFSKIFLPHDEKMKSDKFQFC